MTTSSSDAELRAVQQTKEAFDLLRSLDQDDRVERSVLGIAGRVREVSPDCVAMSLSLHQSGLTFTVAADHLFASFMDAVQYLDGGPCVDAAEDDVQVATPLAGVTDESRWAMFARAEAHTGIASTLSLPVFQDDSVTATVNLYGATIDAFDGRHERLAEVCGAWSSGAVANADLTFQSLVRAAATPGRIVDRGHLDLAAGIVASAQDIEPDDAAARIERAANLAGVGSAEFARFVLDVIGADGPPDT